MEICLLGLIQVHAAVCECCIDIFFYFIFFPLFVFFIFNRMLFELGVTRGFLAYLVSQGLLNAFINFSVGDTLDTQTLKALYPI